MAKPLKDCKIPEDGLPKLYQSEAHKLGDWVRIKGVVLGESGVVAGELTLTVKDNATTHRFPEAPRIQLAGQEVSLQCDACCIVPPFEHEERWSELASRPETAPFQSKAPGPHVKVTLRGWALYAGQTIEVLGRVSKMGLSSESEEFRESAKEVIAEVEASLLAHGDDAATLLESTYHEAKEQQKPPPPPGKPLRERIGEAYRRLATFVLTHKIILGIIGWFGLALFFTMRWGQTDFFFGLSMLTVALYYYYRLAPLPPFFTAESHTTKKYTRDSWVWWVGVGGLVVSLVFRFLGSTNQRTKDGRRISAMEARDLQIMVLCVFLLAVLFLIVEHVRLTRASWRVAWLMLRTPKATPGQWGYHLGAPIQRRETLLSHTESQQKKVDKITDLDLSGNIVYQGETFTLQEDGADKAVNPPNAVWSSTTFAFSPWSTSSSKESLSRTFRMRALSAQQLMIVGRAQGDQLAATGPESLFIFAADENPRSVLWRRFLFSWLVMLSLVGVLVASIASMLR